MANPNDTLEQRRQDLITRQARLNVFKEQGEKDMEKCLAEMKELGTSPETIDTDLKQAIDNDEAQKLAYEQSLKDYEQQLTTAEQALNPTTIS